MATEANETRLTIVSVNFFSGDLLHAKEALIDGVPGVEFVVVDNSGEFVPSSASTNVIQSGGNVGFGKACNLGAASARGDVIAFLNPDADMDIPELLSLACSLGKSDRAIVGPAIYDHEGAVRGLFKPGRFGLLFRRGYHGADSLARDEIQVPYVSGACMVVPSSFFRELGGFFDGIFLYAEDLELCQRASTVGAKVAMYPHYAVQHRGGRSSSKLSSRLKRFGRSFSGHFRFFRKQKLPLLSAWINAAHLASGVRV